MEMAHVQRILLVNVPIDDSRFATPPQQQGPGPGRGAQPR